MCVIIVKKSGIDLPNKSTLEACWKRNPHGAGFMFNDDDYVIIRKGFMNFDEFYLRLKTANEFYHLKERAVVIHFRISTSGLVDKGNCHPFPISNSNDDLRNTSIVTKLGIAHNGIIQNYNGKSKLLNDTQLFIKNDLFELYSLNNKFYLNEVFQSMIKKLIDESKMVLLDNTGKMIKIGKWYEDDGLFFSNLNHLVKCRSLDFFKLPKHQNEMKFLKDFDSDEEECILNEEKVDKDYFDLFKDTLNELAYGDSVYSDDFEEEYNGSFGKYLLDTEEKIIYEMIDMNELVMLGYYKTKEDFYEI